MRWPSGGLCGRTDGIGFQFHREIKIMLIELFSGRFMFDAEEPSRCEGFDFSVTKLVGMTIRARYVKEDMYSICKKIGLT